MPNLQVDRKLIFVSSDLLRPRNVVEKEKVDNMFPQFSFINHNGHLAIRGRLKTNFSYYTVRITTTDNYPYHIPVVEIVDGTIKSGCPHRYVDGTVCLMRPDEWTSTFSLALLVARSAIWLNKYEYWNRHGTWPGNEQSH